MGSSASAYGRHDWLAASLENQANTCFLNAVLQELAHNLYHLLAMARLPVDWLVLLIGLPSPGPSCAV